MVPDDPGTEPPRPPPPPGSSSPPPRPPAAPPSDPDTPSGPPPAGPPPGPPPASGGFPGWLVVIAVVLVIGGVAGAVLAFSGGDERLTRAELVSRVETLCSDFREESDELDEATSTEEVERAVAQRQPLLEDLVADFDALRPPEDDEDEYERFIAEVEQIRDVNDELGERVSADTTFGDVIDLVARGRTSAAVANEALDDLGAEPCDDGDAESVTAEELRSEIGESFFAAASLPSRGPAQVACVTDGVVDLRLDIVLSFEGAESQDDLPPGALADLGAVLDDCVPLVPVLEQVFLAQGLPPDTALCLAEAAASRLGWEGILRGGLSGDTAAIEAEIAEAAAGCPSPGGRSPADPFPEES